MSNIHYYAGNVFNADVDALAHGCNTQGIMGAGVAKSFRKRYPQMFSDYKTRCKNGSFRPGDAYMYPCPERPHIINMATQEQPADRGGRAKAGYIRSAFHWVAQNYGELGIESIAMPPIGTGYGGLKRETFFELVDECLSGLELRVEIWEK